MLWFVTIAIGVGALSLLFLETVICIKIKGY